jgi:toxin FitB
LSGTFLYLLDTNVVSEWVKPRPNPNVVRWLADADEDRISLSIITLAELDLGVEVLAPGERRDTLSDWVRNELPDRFEGRILGIDIKIATSWGMLIGRSRRMGINLHPIDGFLAATAHATSLKLVTRNTAHFAKLGIELENPWLERF